MDINKILIRVSKNAEGYVFRLDPRAKKLLLKIANTPSIAANKLFIAYDSNHDFQELFGNFYQQVVTLLTGLTPDALLKLGGVQFIDSVDETVLFEKELVNV